MCHCDVKDDVAPFPLEEPRGPGARGPGEGREAMVKLVSPNYIMLHFSMLICKALNYNTL